MNIYYTSWIYGCILLFMDIYYYSWIYEYVLLLMDIWICQYRLLFMDCVDI